MREILFKAKRIGDGEWVEGFYVNFKNVIHYILVCDGHGFMWYEVGKETICQYTGLTDKNGKKIWENDVVRHEDLTNGRYIFREQPMKNSCIKWNKSETRFERNDGGSLYHSNNVEVIGNIFDNPELMEGGASNE